MMSRYPAWCIALHIEGLPRALGTSDSSGVLLTNMKLPSLPAGMPTFVNLDWIDDTANGVTGFSFSTGIRQPFPDGNSINFKIFDMDDDSVVPTNTWVLSKIFARKNLGFMNGWLTDKTVISESDTTLTLNGRAAPVIDQIYWIEEEAVQIASVTELSEVTFLVEISRGVCGSRARRHEIQPKLYAPNDDGSAECIRIDAQPDFDTYRFPATVYYIRIDDAGTPTTMWTRFGYIEGQPKPGLTFWTITVADIVKKMGEHRIEPDDEPTYLNYNIQVVDVLNPVVINGVGLGHGKLPNIVYMWMDRYSAERFFNVALHRFGQHQLDTSLCNDLISAFEYAHTVGTYSEVSYKVEVESNGHKFIFSLCSIALATVTKNGVSRKLLKVGMKIFRDSNGTIVIDPDASINDSPVNMPNAGFGNGIPGFSGNLPSFFGIVYNSGWVDQEAVPIPQGYEQPKVSFRIHLNTTPVRALLYLMLSGSGRGLNDPEFDLIIGWRGLNMDRNKINFGVSTGDILNVTSINEDTTDLLKLNELITQKFNYRLTSKDGFKDFATNIMRLHLLMMGPVPGSGKITLRKWMRNVNNTVTVLDPINRDSKSLRLDQKLDRISAIRVYADFEELEFRPRVARTVRLGGATAVDLKSDRLQEIKIYAKQSFIDDPALQFGMFHDLIFAWFTILREAPQVYNVETSVEDTFPLTFGDSVELTDDSIPDSTNGRGVTSQRFIVIANDVDFDEGVQTLKIIEDPVNLISNATASMAPAFRCLTLYDVYRDLYTFTVQSINDDSFDPTNSSYNELIRNMAGVQAWARVVMPGSHNPAVSDTDPDGWFEYYGQVVSYDYLPGKVATITLQIDSTWERDGRTIAGTFDSEQTFILLADYRIADINIQGVLISPPIDIQNYNVIAPGGGQPPLLGIVYTIGTV